MSEERPAAETVVIETIRALLARRAADDSALGPHSDLYDDLRLDSLEVAELSAVLEEQFGTDPYTAGSVPRTVGDVIAFYDPAPA